MKAEEKKDLVNSFETWGAALLLIGAVAFMTWVTFLYAPASLVIMLFGGCLYGIARAYKRQAIAKKQEVVPDEV